MSTTSTDRPLRVIQWTTGNIGRRSLHAIIGRPDMELVGVYAHGADKVGVDAAELSGWPEPTGRAGDQRHRRAARAATRRVLLQPVVAQRRRAGAPAGIRRQRLHQRGLDHRRQADPAGPATHRGRLQARQFDDLRQRRTSGDDEHGRHGAQSASCERVDEIRITESVDCSTYESAETQTAMGFSQDPDTPGLAESVRRESEVFAESAAMMADAIGAKLDRMTFDVTFTAATGDSDLGFMTIPAGTIGGVYGYHRGWVGDRNVVSVGFNWIMGNHVDPPKPLEHGHVIQVFGLPNMRTVLHCLPPKDWTEPGFMGLGMIYTAMPVTNAVPAVVAAEPGIMTLADLPPVTGRVAG